MRASTYIRFAQFRTFWHLRKLLQAGHFRILRWYFVTSAWTTEKKHSSGLLARFGYVTTGQLFFAFLISAAIWIVEILADRVGVFGRWAVPNSNDYVSVMGTVAQIGGVFIALYYTALASVAATVFAKVPTTIRNLLVGERIGSLYMRYLAFATFLPLIFIGLTLLGVPPFHLAVPFVIIMAGLGVLLFVRLGQAAFNLLDPTSLAFGVFEDFQKSVNQVSSQGFSWLDKSFQNHAHQVATNDLEALSALYDLCFRSPHLRGTPLLKLVKSTSWLLNRYQLSKSQIPPKSYWFERKYRHPAWYLSPDHHVTTAQQTGTPIMPEVIFDSWWVEKTVEPLLLKYLHFSLRNSKKGSTSTEFLDTIGAYVETLAAEFQLNHAVELLEEVGKEVRKIVNRGEGDSVVDDLTLAALGEYYGQLATKLLLGFSRAVESLRSEAIRHALEKIDWQSDRSLHSTKLPGFIIPRLEWLGERIRFEHAIEGRVITPLWYQQELVNQCVAEHLKDALPLLYGTLQQDLPFAADFVPNEHQVWFIAGFLRARWELLKKMAYHSRVISRGTEAFRKPIVLTDLPWPDITMERFVKTVQDAEDKLLVEMAKIIGLLVGKPRQEELPDYRGHFLQNLAEACLEALSENDEQLLRKLFPIFFIGSMAEFDLLKPSQSEDRDFVARVQIALGPVLDLIEISGQAFVFSELHGNPLLWNLIKSTWDLYLQKVPNSLRQVAAIVSHGKPRFAIAPRAVIRTGWSRQLLNALEKVDGDPNRLSPPSRSRPVQHSSPLIRYLASRTYFLYEPGIEVFVSLYATKVPGADEVEWPEHRDEHLSKIFDEGLDEQNDTDC